MTKNSSNNNPRSLSKGKTRRHIFADRFPALAAILLIFASTTAVQAIAMLINGVLVQGIKAFTSEYDCIGYIVGSLIVLWIYKRWFNPEFEGNLRDGKPAEGIRLSLFILIYWGVCFPIQFMFTSAVFGWPTLNTLGIALTAGFTEELAFRGLPASLLMRQWCEERKIPLVMILTSVIFGAVHLTNYFSGADLGCTILQAVSAVGVGLFFCGIYLRCANLLITIALHSIHDILSFLDVSGINAGVIVQTVTWFSFVDTAFSIALGVLGIWMVRPSKREEIRSLWNRKWNISPDKEYKDT